MGKDEQQTILRSFIIFLVATILIGMVAAFSYEYAQSEEALDGVIIDTTVNIEKQKPSPQALQTKIKFFGDVMWGRRNHDLAEANGGPEYLFEKLDSLGRATDDAWIINIECPITTQVLSKSDQEDLLLFNCPLEYLPFAEKWFDVASLSNNHTANIGGQAGLVETRGHLDETSIQYFGHFDNAMKDDICEVVSIDARIQTDDGSEMTVKLPIAMCGFHGVFKLIQPDELAQLAKFGAMMPTFVMPHMGAEYQPSNDQIRQSQYRSMIDNGADLVAGGHPHWVQNTEVYKDKLIAYSLGNFIFDQAWSVEVQRGVGLGLELTAEYDNNLQGWIDLGEQCEVFKDDCLEMAQEQGLKKINFKYNYDIIATQYTNGQTMKANDSVQEIITERMNWAETLHELATEGESN